MIAHRQLPSRMDADRDSGPSFLRSWARLLSAATPGAVGHCDFRPDHSHFDPTSGSFPFLA